MEKLAEEMKRCLGANHIMLSYNWASAKALVQKVHDSLADLGLPLWMDTEGGMHGSIAGAMADAVENASIIIPFMTEKYQESKACNQEFEYANDIGVTIVPVRAQDMTADGKKYRARGKVGILVAGKLYVDFTDLDLYEEKIEELLINIGFGLMDPEKVMKLVQEGKNDHEASEDADKRLPLSIITTDMQLDSKNMGYTETELGGPILSISVIKQDSQSALIQGTSFGFIGNRVWVDNGARGKFRVVYTTSRAIKVVPEEGEGARTIMLQSFKSKRKERIMDKDVKEVHLIKQLSQSACTLGESFGFEGSKVWVDKGARGIFKIEYV